MTKSKNQPTGLKLAGATLNQTPLDWKGNLTNIFHAIQKAKLEKADLLCLPELCITGYGCEDMFLAPWVSEKATEILLNDILLQTAEMAVFVGLPIQFEAKTFDCVAACIDGKLQGFYAKQMLALDGLHYESRWFSAWESGTVKQISIQGHSFPIGDQLFDYKGFKIGIELCEEAWRGKQRTAIKHAERGADIILNPSASHFAFGKTHERENLVRQTREFFNGTYIYTNLLGNEAGRVIYEGEILIGKQGRIVGRNSHFSFNQVESVVFDDSESELRFDIHFKENKFEAFRQAEALGLFDYMRKSKSQGFTLSLSGGADSACCAVLVAEMVKEGIKQLGSEKFAIKSGLAKLLQDLSAQKWLHQILNTAYQSTENSGVITKDAAAGLATEIGTNHHDWNVQSAVNNAIETVSLATGTEITWQNQDLSLQNIQSRMRSPYIWLLANLTNSLLLTTSNRSEGDVGYATMDGDTSGGLAPIAGVDKHFIRQWLVWAEQELGYKSLSAINIQAPTAELRPPEAGQTDEKDLMPYTILVEIEREAIYQRKSPEEVLNTLINRQLTDEKVLKQYINRFFTLWAQAQWKRERLAPSFHLDDFNIDPRSWFRFPILSGGFADDLNPM